MTTVEHGTGLAGSPSIEVRKPVTAENRPFFSSLLAEKIVGMLTPLALLFAWEAIVRLGLVDARFFPAPSSIGGAFNYLVFQAPWVDSLPHQVLISLRRVGIGFWYPVCLLSARMRPGYPQLVANVPEILRQVRRLPRFFTAKRSSPTGTTVGAEHQNSSVHLHILRGLANLLACHVPVTDRFEVSMLHLRYRFRRRACLDLTLYLLKKAGYGSVASKLLLCQKIIDFGSHAEERSNGGGHLLSRHDGVQDQQPVEQRKHRLAIPHSCQCIG